MKFKNYILLFICIFLMQNTVKSQYFNNYYNNRDILQKNDTSKLFLRIENSNFFKNNEYFNNFYEGYTLIGYFIKPQVVWNISKSLQATGGVHLQKYSGIQKFTEILQVFRIQYRPNEKFTILLGTLYSTSNHNLQDIIFDSEKYLTENNETGTQILYNSKFIKSDIWLNWQSFIFHESPYPERFTFGTSNSILINPGDENNKFSIPLQAVVTHVGGQIDASDVNIQSLANSGIGVDYKYITEKYKFELKEMYYTFTDISPSKVLPFIQGFGISSEATVFYSNIQFSLGHFFGKDFITTRGNPIFQSISKMLPEYSEQERALITNSLYYTKKIVGNSIFGIGGETYFDLYNKNLDYLYSIYISVNFESEIKTNKIF